MQKSTFEEIKRLESSFYGIGVQVITHPFSRLKNTKHLIFCLLPFFMTFF